MVEEGKISESRIDLSVRRILTVKEQLGLLEDNGTDLPMALTMDEREGLFGTAAQAALECITVLKNEGSHLVYPDKPVLPLGAMAPFMSQGRLPTH